MRATAPGASTRSSVRSPMRTAPLNRAVGIGTTCAAGSASRSHAHCGKVKSGAADSAQRRSQDIAPAVPRITSPSRWVAADTNHARPPASAACGSGPNRQKSPPPSGGNAAAHPCTYGSPDSGATSSWCTHSPYPLRGSVSVAYQTSRRPGWPRHREGPSAAASARSAAPTAASVIARRSIARGPTAPPGAVQNCGAMSLKDLALRRLAADGDAFFAAAERDPAAPVRACPGWTVDKLVGHLGRIHTWAAQVVRSRTVEPVSPRLFPEGPDDPSLRLRWGQERHSELLAALGELGEEEPRSEE